MPLNSHQSGLRAVPVLTTSLTPASVGLTGLTCAYSITNTCISRAYGPYLCLQFHQHLHQSGLRAVPVLTTSLTPASVGLTGRTCAYSFTNTSISRAYGPYLCLHFHQHLHQSGLRAVTVLTVSPTPASVGLTGRTCAYNFTNTCINQAYGPYLMFLKQ
jgi:hypothetical protein